MNLHTQVKPITPAIERLTYRADIDGLRSIAVGTVVLYHAFPHMLSGGFIGVDVFFVISGFLITSIVAQEAEEGRFSIARFYERRARRILPALLVLLFAVVGVALIFSPPSDVREMSKGLAGAATFSSNLIFWKGRGYFAADAHETALLHTWSLAVEEQFYLTWPLLLAVIVRRRPLLWICGLGLLSLISSVIDVARSPTTAFYLPYDRAWELLLGAALVFLRRLTMPNLARSWLSLLGLAAILTSAALFTAKTPFPGVAALPTCLGTALIILLGRSGDTIVHRVLRYGPLVLLGQISYSLYLWHWPVLVYARLLLDRPTTLPETALALICAVGLAAVSWKFVEQPLRRAPGSTQLVLLSSGAALVAVAAVAGTLYLSGGLPARASSPTLLSESALRDVNPLRSKCVAGTSQHKPPQGCTFGKGDARWVVWGDSHADAVTPGFVELAGKRGVQLVEMAKHSCPPLLNPRSLSLNAHCLSFNQSSLTNIASVKPDLVVVAARWGVILQPSFADFSPEGGAVDARKAALLRKDLTATLIALRTTVGPGSRILVIGPIPEARIPVAKCRARAQFTRQDVGRLCPDINRNAYNQWSGAVDDALRSASAEAGAIYLSPAIYLCDHQICPTAVEGAPNYFDDNHLTGRGARILVERAAAAGVF